MYLKYRKYKKENSNLTTKYFIKTNLKKKKIKKITFYNHLLFFKNNYLKKNYNKTKKKK